MTGRRLLGRLQDVLLAREDAGRTGRDLGVLLEAFGQLFGLGQAAFADEGGDTFGLVLEGLGAVGDAFLQFRGQREVEDAVGIDVAGLLAPRAFAFVPRHLALDVREGVAQFPDLFLERCEGLHVVTGVERRRLAAEFRRAPAAAQGHLLLGQGLAELDLRCGLRGIFRDGAGPGAAFACEQAAGGRHVAQDDGADGVGGLLAGDVGILVLEFLDRPFQGLDLARDRLAVLLALGEELLGIAHQGALLAGLFAALLEFAGEVDGHAVGGLGLLLVAAALGLAGLGQEVLLPLAQVDVGLLLGQLDGLGGGLLAALARGPRLALALGHVDVAEEFQGVAGLDRVRGGRGRLLEHFAGLVVVVPLIERDAGPVEVFGQKGLVLLVQRLGHVRGGRSGGRGLGRLGLEGGRRLAGGRFRGRHDCQGLSVRLRFRRPGFLFGPALRPFGFRASAT